MPKLFVIMPYGARSAQQAPGGLIDFDMIYRDLIRPATIVAGWDVLRIDELAEPGQISNQYLREILFADLVLADISISNANVFYELGIRQAISTGGSVLIAYQGTTIPFDLSSQRVLFYSLELDEDLKKAREEIRRYLTDYLPTEHGNPVRLFLEKIGATTSPMRDVAAFERELNGRIERSHTVDQLIAVWQWARNLSPLPVGSLLTLAERLSDSNEWLTASNALSMAAQQNPDDFEIHRKLGWYLQQLGPKHDAEALKEYERALALNPQDPETLGMMGGRLKRAGRYSEAVNYYREAIRHSPNNLYNLINLACLSILSDPANPQDGIHRYEDLIRRLEEKGSVKPDMWTELVLGEAYFATGESVQAEAHFLAAIQLASSPKSLESAARQLDLLASAGFRAVEASRLASLLRRERSVEIATQGLKIETKEPNLPILIHISDLHFGSLLKDGKKQDMHRFHDGENSQRLSQHLYEEISSARSRLRGNLHRLHLIVSGDLTSNGSSQEFDEARLCLEEICARLPLSKDRVHIIPGNHDVNWKFAAADPNFRFYPYFQFLGQFYGEEILERKFPFMRSRKMPNQQPKPNEIVLIDYDDALRLLVIGLNSCIFETEQHHYGFVGERQLRAVRDHLDEMNVPRDAFRLALIHHHLHPFPELLDPRDEQEVWLDLSTIRDAGRVESFLEKLRFDLVLHGHKHKPLLRETLMYDRKPFEQDPRQLIVCGAGSVSCSSLQLEHGEANHYEIVEVMQTPRREGAKFLRVEWRVLPYVAGAEWQTAENWDLLG